MKTYSLPFLQSAVLAVSLALVPSAEAATLQWDGGAGTGDWQTAANWNPDALNNDFNGTFGNRLNVNGTQGLIYTSAEGTTNYTGGGDRGLVIGSVASGSMSITGGTFSTLGAGTDVIGNGNSSTGILTINGGHYIGTDSGTVLGLGTGTGRVSTLNVQSGSATIATLTMNSTLATINLSGSGLLAVNNIAKVSGSTANINFDGGTLQARTNTTGFLAGLDNATVNGGGVTVDSNGSNITIGQALLAGTGSGGLAKTGNGTLTLSGTNTYTGATTLSQGAVSVGSSANLGDAASDLVFDGGTLQVTGTSLTSLSGIGHAVVLNAGKTVGLDINSSSNTFTADQVLDQTTGGLLKLGAGRLVLNQNNTYTGDTTISAGAIIKQAADSTTGNISVANGATFVLDGGITDGAGQSISIDGPGSTSGNYFYPGSAVQRGALQAQNGASTWEGDIVINGTSNTRIGVQEGASLTLTGNISESVAGSILLFRAGAAGSDITLGGSGTYTYTGETQIYSSGGAVVLGADDKLPTASAVNFTSGGSTVFDLNGHDQTVAGIYGGASGSSAIITNNGSGACVLTVAPATADSYYHQALIQDGSSAVSFVKNGEGTQTLAGANTYTGSTTVNAGQLVINGNQSATGDVIINGGSVKLSSGKTLASGVNVSIAGGGSLYLDGSNQTIGKLEGAGTVDFTYNSAGTDTLTVGANDASSTFDGVIQQSTARTYALTKTGTGTLTLTGDNTYTGATTVSGGILAVDGSLANTTTTVESGGTLAGSGSLEGSVTIDLGGTLAAGNSIESLATGALALNAGSTFAYEIDNGAAPTVAGDLTAVTGDLTLDAGNGAILTLAELGSGSWDLGDKLTLISYSDTWNGGLFDYLGGTVVDDSTLSFSGVDWLFDYDDTNPGSNFTGDLVGTNFVTMTVIPEPSCLPLASLLVIMLWRRRPR